MIYITVIYNMFVKNALKPWNEYKSYNQEQILTHMFIWENSKLIFNIVAIVRCMKIIKEIKNIKKKYKVTKL